MPPVGRKGMGFVPLPAAETGKFGRQEVFDLKIGSSRTRIPVA